VDTLAQRPAPTSQQQQPSVSTDGLKQSDSCSCSLLHHKLAASPANL